MSEQSSASLSTEITLQISDNQVKQYFQTCCWRWHIMLVLVALAEPASDDTHAAPATYSCNKSCGCS